MIECRVCAFEGLGTASRNGRNSWDVITKWLCFEFSIKLMDLLII